MIGFAYNFGWLAFALGTMWLDRRKHGAQGEKGGDGLVIARKALAQRRSHHWHGHAGAAAKWQPHGRNC